MVPPICLSSFNNVSLCSYLIIDHLRLINDAITYRKALSRRRWQCWDVSNAVASNSDDSVSDLEGIDAAVPAEWRKLKQDSHMYVGKASGLTWYMLNILKGQ